MDYRAVVYDGSNLDEIKKLAGDDALVVSHSHGVEVLVEWRETLTPGSIVAKDGFGNVFLPTSKEHEAIKERERLIQDVCRGYEHFDEQARKGAGVPFQYALNVAAKNLAEYERSRGRG